MIIKLPTVITTPKYDGDEITEIQKEKKYIKFKIDDGLHADMRFEEYFKEKSNYNSFQEYKMMLGKELKSWKKNPNKAEILSVMRYLYCILDSEEAPTFIDFIHLFDLKEIDVLKEFFEKVVNIIEMTNNSIIKN